ncbi:CRISPR-associated endoribonuclease Cas6 [Nostoc sp. FACHB-87]|uniref:CRISPR-associated endoribonuclease Cas6 n=1 Tax=Nostocaceae TaxID=1162 RepID=UPI00168578C8|nr:MULTISPECIES: CRISPR-associated endoribonuclease Cas6 [Nostocaceae]MBD2458954.1 CRISPR-associated endoribonuclease Cas6 [Nostoc sp. FACHB-87]MBD2479956.1 CRISPR-associated endoribonuclease Cas6 [Anabaena sp. FACHB-83]
MDAAVLSPPKSANLYAVVIELGAASQQPVPVSLGRALHAQFMDWLTLADPQTADIIHHAQISPFSLSGLIGYRRQIKTKLGDNFIFRICLLDGNLIDLLLQGLDKWDNQPLYLGNCPFVIRNSYTLPGTHPLADTSDYAKLANIDPVSDEITLKFLSPTSFKQKQEVQPFPLPELVFNNLLRRWNFFAPQEIRLPSVEWKAVVSGYELKTFALQLEVGGEIGAEGWVRYRFNDNEQAKIATVLAHFAHFAGVGRKTTMGMGQTSIQNSKLR